MPTAKPNVEIQLAEFERLVAEKKQQGKARGEAVAELKKTHEELHKAYHANAHRRRSSRSMTGLG